MFVLLLKSLVIIYDESVVGNERWGNSPRSLNFEFDPLQSCRHHYDGSDTSPDL